MYQLKPETIEQLRAIPESAATYQCARKNSGNSLNFPLASYYSKPQYSRRTDKWRIYPGTWQTDDSMRENSPHAYNYERKYFADKFPDWRNVGFADEIIRLEHTGWYCDYFYSETVRGTVLQLPARHGEPHYIPAISWTDRDGVTVWPLDSYDDKEDCARAADSYAEHAAELDREAAIEDQAEQDIEAAKDDIAEARGFVHALIKDIRDSANIKPGICSVLRARIASERETVRQAVETIRKRRDEPYTAIERFQ